MNKMVISIVIAYQDFMKMIMVTANNVTLLVTSVMMEVLMIVPIVMNN